MRLRRVAIHGHEIAYCTAGAGPTLVLLHGMAGSSGTWRHVIPALAREFTVVALDLPGHGASAKPHADYSIGAYANAVRDLMAVLGHERASLVGQSFGGGVAMQVAYQHPERCERLVLVGSGGLGVEVNPLLRALSVPGADVALPLGCRALVRDLGARTAAWLAERGRPAHPALVEIARAYASLTDADTRRAFVQTLRAVVDRHGQRLSARDRLYLTAGMPTLIVWGDRDPIIPVRHAHEAHAAIPGSRLELFPGVGHFPHCEAPERFARVVSEFVRTTPATDASSARWRGLLAAASMTG